MLSANVNEEKKDEYALWYDCFFILDYCKKDEKYAG
jgi:hypothetical protein